MHVAKNTQHELLTHLILEFKRCNRAEKFNNTNIYIKVIINLFNLI
jgi:hypothetical protein